MVLKNKESYYPILFPYAYNILGIVEDAQDAVQDIILKHLTAPNTELQNEKAYLIRSVINHAINKKKRNAKSARENWLPEPLETQGADHGINTREILSYSLLVLMECLTARERAVYILKQAFDYSHQEIADVFSITIENSRKLLGRANSKLKDRTDNKTSTTSAFPTILNDYIAVIRTGDLASLENMLSKDILVKADGGSKFKVVSELTTGIEAVSKLMVYVYKKYQQNFSIVQVFINHQPALLFLDEGILINCQVFEFEQNNTKIKRIYSIVDTDKLKNIKFS